ncbi:MAG: ATP phosphoribosyltransferase [Candidatus Pacebacteria bacterium]|nr:ATP phosphoribosyltransferase [Candidatus Paceibacterota bacterium]
MKEAINILSKAIETQEDLRIAIQKDGRLSAISWALLSTCLETAGIDVPEIDSKKRDKRVVISPILAPNLKIGLFKQSDIPRLVERGQADFGIVGEDKAIEMGLEDLIATKLGSAESSLVIQIPKNSPITTLEGINGKTIATSFPKIVANYLATKNIIPKSIEYMDGSVEGAPAFGVADITADLVQSGSGMRDNDLRPLITVRNFEAVFLKGKNALMGTSTTNT